jgi:hypothetical protein
MCWLVNIYGYYIAVCYAVAQLFVALHYKPDGRGFDFQFCHWHSYSGRTMVLGLTQSLTEMSTRNTSWGKGGRCVGLTTLPYSCAFSLNLGASTPWNTRGLSRPVMGWPFYMAVFCLYLQSSSSSWTNFYPENGGKKFFWIRYDLKVDTLSHSRRLNVQGQQYMCNKQYIYHYL